jgi:hypothetical protein
MNIQDKNPIHHLLSGQPIGAQISIDTNIIQQREIEP